MTGIRGIAACYVLIYHALYFTDLPGPVGSLLRHGYLSVDLFFVLSGFVLGLTDGQDFARFGSADFGQFLIRRVARIYPLYLFALLLFCRPGPIGVVYPLSNLLLIQSWCLAPSVDNAAWSISAEWLAYILFPLLCLLSLGRSALVAIGWAMVSITAVVVLATLSRKLLLYDFPSMGPLDLVAWRSPAPLIRCIAEFSLGLLTFRLSRPAPPASATASRLLQAALAVGIVALLAVPNADMAIVALLPPLVWSLSSDRGPVASVLGSRPIHWLGVISYSIYLLHPLLLPLHDETVGLFTSAPPVLRETLGVLAVIAPTIAAATLTYAVIERGGRRLVMALIARASPRLAAARIGPG